MFLTFILLLLLHVNHNVLTRIVLTHWMLRIKTTWLCSSVITIYSTLQLTQQPVHTLPVSRKIFNRQLFRVMMSHLILRNK